MPRFATLLLGALLLAPLAAALPSVPAPSSVQPPSLPPPERVAGDGAGLAVAAVASVAATDVEALAAELAAEAVEEGEAQTMAALAAGDGTLNATLARSPAPLPDAPVERPSLEGEGARVRVFAEAKARTFLSAWSGWAAFFGAWR